MVQGLAVLRLVKWQKRRRFGKRPVHLAASANSSTGVVSGFIGAGWRMLSFDALKFAQGLLCEMMRARAGLNRKQFLLKPLAIKKRASFELLGYDAGVEGDLC